MKRLRGYASRYSFIRVLDKIIFYETNILSTYMGHELAPNSSRIINSELALLIGLWVDNINFEADDWGKGLDESIISKIYNLMDGYHKTFLMDSYGNVHKEVAAYEGDGAFVWQFVDLAEIKYTESKDFLKGYYGYDIYAATSFFYKILKEYLSRVANVLENRTFNDYERIGAIFQYSLTELQTLLNKDEFQVLSQFTIVLGEKGGEEIKDISSISNYSTHPVIKLPNGNYYIPNLYILAKAINESPYYWLKNSPDQKKLRTLLGKSNEHIAYSLLRRCIGDNVYKGILIKKEHAKKEETDIDAMFSIDNDVFVVQVKSKKLTQPSADGNEESIMIDFGKAVLSAYNQGLKSVDALRLHDEYPNLSKYTSSINNPLYHIICITGDYFPTLSSTVYEHQQQNQNPEFPIVAMTMFDLETITYFFEASKLKDYLVFRENCSRLMIYGDNEMYYLGKFIALNTEPDEPELSFGEILYRDYAVLVDYIIQCAKADDISSNAFSYFWKFIEDDTSPLLTELAIVYHSLREKPRKFRNGMRMFDPKDHNKYMYFK